MTAYYDVNPKRRRHALLRAFPAFTATEAMLEDLATLQAAVIAVQPDVIMHPAAQAFVRYSLENPHAYIDANLVGTYHVLEMLRQSRPRHFLLVSTSGVNGANADMPCLGLKANRPLTLYAATKKASEATSHAGVYIHKIPTIISAFLLFASLGTDPTWHWSSLLAAFLKACRLTFTTTAKYSATLPISMTWCMTRLLIDVPPPTPEDRCAQSGWHSVEVGTLSTAAPS